MFWLKSIIITIQAARLVGLLGISDDVEDIIKSFDLEEICDYDMVSDFLSMDTEEFEGKYDKNELYERDILYCTQEAWRYQGVPTPSYDGAEIYDVDDITAIRFINICPLEEDMPGKDDALGNFQKVEMLLLPYYGDCVASMFFQEKKDAQGREELKLTEFSFLKVKMSEHDRREVAPEELYRVLEWDYYYGWKELQQAEWKVSPGGTKAVYIINGLIPNSPSQIFVRYQEKIPDLIFRRTWECHFTDWIDEDHFICYNDSGPIMIHLETRQIENIKQEEDDYDAWGCEYEIKGDQLLATCLGEEYYRWDIIRKDGDIRIIKTENQDEDKED